MKTYKKTLILCIIFCIGLVLLSGCAHRNEASESKAIGGEIIHIVDLSKEKQLDQTGYIIYVHAYVGDLMTIWVSDDTNLVDGQDGLSWEDIFSQQRTGVWFSGIVRPTETIDDNRLPNLFVAEELTLQRQTAEQGGVPSE